MNGEEEEDERWAHPGGGDYMAKSLKRRRTVLNEDWCCTERGLSVISGEGALTRRLGSDVLEQVGLAVGEARVVDILHVTPEKGRVDRTRGGGHLLGIFGRYWGLLIVEQMLRTMSPSDSATDSFIRANSSREATLKMSNTKLHFSQVLLSWERGQLRLFTW